MAIRRVPVEVVNHKHHDCQIIKRIQILLVIGIHLANSYGTNFSFEHFFFIVIILLTTNILVMVVMIRTETCFVESFWLGTWLVGELLKEDAKPGG